ncbi:MAG TPA: response regulator [Methylococcaceae bacterium]|nr:response regulator [Methylococcaceae bacterium]
MAKILIIDDDADIRELLTLVLQQDHHDVFVAEDGQRGIAFHQQEKFDVIITDIVMPNKDGVEFILELAEHGDGTPIIAISGGNRDVGGEFNLVSAQTLGVNAILKKPFDTDELREMITRILG